MTTKEQERKALEQIKKIVEGLGEDSYIGTAFEGCFEIAETNIENDWACSYKQENESLEERIEKQAKDSDLLMHQKEHLTKKVDDQIRQSQANWEVAEENKADCAEWVRKYNDKQKEVDALQEKVDNLEAELHYSEEQIIRLKAKLYDLLVK